MSRTTTINPRAVISENAPPSVAKASKRQRTTSGVGSRRRHLAMLSNTTARSPHFLAEQAKKKISLKGKSTEKLDSSPSRSHQPSKPVQPSEPETVTYTVKRLTKTGEAEEEREIPITVPRRLGRPETMEISEDALSAILDPSGPRVPAEYIRERMVDLTSEMFKAVQMCKPSFCRNSLPEQLPMHIPSPDLIAPTHILAVSPYASPANQPKPVQLYPVHSLVLGAHCTKLPPFERVESSASTAEDSSIMTPVRSICVPSPGQFPDLLAYLYTKDKTPLLRSLLPLGGPLHNLDDDATLRAFATHIGRKFQVESLMETVFKIHACWSNVCSLGIFDKGLWEQIDRAWEVVLTAMSVSAGQPHLVLVPGTSRAETPSASPSHPPMRPPVEDRRYPMISDAPSTSAV